MTLNLREFVFAAGLTATAFCPGLALAEETKNDSRLASLKKFFSIYRSPLAANASEFLQVSDKFGLDWRLMPTLVILESGGRNLRNNNVFGWGNGASRFRSVKESISVVADCLANKMPYRGKTLEDKMKAYNPRRKDYADLVRKVMGQIAPEQGVLVVATAARGTL